MATYRTPAIQSFAPLSSTGNCGTTTLISGSSVPIALNSITSSGSRPNILVCYQNYQGQILTPGGLLLPINNHATSPGTFIISSTGGDSNTVGWWAFDTLGTDGTSVTNQLYSNTNLPVSSGTGTIAKGGSTLTAAHATVSQSISGYSVLFATPEPYGGVSGAGLIGCYNANSFHSTTSSFDVNSGTIVSNDFSYLVVNPNGSIGTNNTYNSKFITTASGSANYGQVQLSGGTATITTTRAALPILLSYSVQSISTLGNVGQLYAGSVSAGTSFVIISSNGSDNAYVSWWIVS